MKSTSLKHFRNIYSNIIIAFVIIALITFSCTVSSVNAFTGNDYSAIYHGDESKPNVSLMINVYWGNEYLSKMLEVLNEKNVKCTFFVGGCWVKSNPDLIRQIRDDGHEIANHGYYHKDHDKISADRNELEIQLCSDIVKETLNLDMELFMPPSGAYNETTLKAANKLGYLTIMWSNDTIDWRDQNEELIVSRATNVKNGALILMHPTKATSNCLSNIIDILQNKGFNLCPVGENIQTSPKNFTDLHINP